MFKITLLLSVFFVFFARFLTSSVGMTDGVENQVVPLITKQSCRSSILNNLSSAKPTIYKN
jgi:hypothetical protein